MCEHIIWRARIGIFNGGVCNGKRCRPYFRKSDIDACTTFLKTYFISLHYSTPHKDLHMFSFLSVLYICNPILFLITSINLCCLTLNQVAYHHKITNRISYLNIFLLILLIISGDIHLNPGPLHHYSICHLNARSLTALNRLNDLEDILVGCNKFDLILVSETHLNNSVSKTLEDISGYDLFRKDRTRYGGGVAIYVRATLSAVRRHDLEIDNIELIWIEFKTEKKSNLVGCCYRPPGQSLAQSNSFLSSFENSLELSLDSQPNSLTIMGDFNDRCTTWNSLHSSSELGNRLHSLLLNLNLFQLIKEPTRELNLLDLLITDSPIHFYDSGTLPPLPGCDHNIIFGKYRYTYTTSSRYSRKIWKYDLGNYTEMNNDLKIRLSNIQYSDINKSTIELSNNILKSMENYVPYRNVHINQKNKPWFTPHVKKLYKKCYKYFRLKNRINNDINIDNYKQARHEAKAAFRLARKNYYKNISDKLANADTTPKYFWKLVKEVYNNNTNSSIPPLLDNGILYTDDKEKAEILNDYFVAQSILPPSENNLPVFTYLTCARLDRIEITPENVKKLLLSVNINKAVGPDKIHNRILKECAESLHKPLAELFQNSLNVGIFPETWKEAAVSSIFKKIDRQIKSNYRPISLLACISKIFEKLVFDKFYNYLIENNLLNANNSGFKPNDSAQNRLLAILETVYAGFDNHQDSIFISLDISKAFDRVWHKGLLFKLKQYGITGNLLLWFNSYLSHRCQRVVVGGKTSSIKYLKAGVPQGSILGPLLFILYINDMTTNLKSNVHQFADDTNLLLTVENPTSAIEILNHDLSLLKSWADQWRVSFNPTKTNFMIFTLKNKRTTYNPIIFDNVQIEETTELVSLGLTINQNLNWNNHVLKLLAKASKRLYILRKYRNLLPRIALTRIYTSMIRPILEFGDIIYDSTTLSTGQSLESFQRQAAIICSGAYRHTSYTSLLHELGWEELSTRRKHHKLILL